MSNHTWKDRYNRARERESTIWRSLLNGADTLLFTAAFFGAMTGAILVATVALFQDWNLLLPAAFGVVSVTAFIGALLRLRRG